MKVSVCRPGELGPSELARWRDLQVGGDEQSHPFLSPDFAVAVDAEFPGARVAVIEDGGTMCAFWPYSVHRGGLARPIAGQFTGREGLVHAPGHVPDLPTLVASCRLSGWAFEQLISAQASDRPGLTHGSANAIVLPDGWDAYEKGLYEAHPSLVKKRRRLESRHRVSVEVGHDSGTLDWIMDAKSAQCRARGWVDPFSRQSTRSFFHRLVADHDSTLEAIVIALRADDDVCAAVFNLRNVHYEAGWIAAFNRAYSVYSPGVLTCLEAFRAAFAEGVEVYDTGQGEEPHKLQLANVSLPVASGFVAAPGVRGAVTWAVQSPARELRHWLARNPAREERARRAVQDTRRFAYRVLDSRGKSPVGTDVGRPGQSG